MAEMEAGIFLGLKQLQFWELSSQILYLISPFITLLIHACISSFNVRWYRLHYMHRTGDFVQPFLKIVTFQRSVPPNFLLDNDVYIIASSIVVTVSYIEKDGSSRERGTIMYARFDIYIRVAW